MKKIRFPILITLTLAFTLFANYWSNSGAMNGTTVGEISRQYDSLFTPAGYAFSIWGLIFLSLIIFVVYQWYSVLSGKGYDASRAGGWLAITNILNGLWTIVWIGGYPGLSVLVMLALLVSLTIVVIKLDMERWDAPIRIIGFVWWPIAIYYGWIILATIANVSAYLVSIGWSAWLSPVSWTILMILIAVVVYIFLIQTRNLRESALVGVWGLIAIVVKQMDTHPTIGYTAIAGIVILVVVSNIHAYKNRSTLPFLRK